MNSFKLLRHLIVFWNAVDNPVFVRETNHPPVWYRFYTRLARASGLSLVLGGLLCYVSIVLVFLLNNMLILVIPLMLFWIVITSLTLAPLVIGERERQTWETLRTIPLDIETILIGKAVGALWWQRDILRVMIGVLLLFTAGIGLVSLILVPTSDDTAGLSNTMLCGAALILPMIIALAFMADRAQQFALTVVSVLATSATVRTGRVALAGAVVIAMLLWLIDVGIAGLLLAVQPGRATLTVETDWMVLASLGPVAGYLPVLPLGKLALYVSGTLIGREILVRLLWHWTVRHAQR